MWNLALCCCLLILPFWIDFFQRFLKTKKANHFWLAFLSIGERSNF
jgi:hypothetical protein